MSTEKGEGPKQRQDRRGWNMKEQTYGWYPSAKNVYEERRLGALTPYQIEALYRYRDSKYYQPPVTPPGQRTPKQPRPASVHRPPPYRPVTGASNASKTSKDTDKKEQLTLRAKSVPLQTKYRPPPKLALPTPLECWSSPTPEAEVASLPDSVKPSSRPASLHKPITPMATPILLPPESVPSETKPVPTPTKVTTPLVTRPPSVPRPISSAPKPVTTPIATPIVVPSAEPEVTKSPSPPLSFQQFVRVQSARVRRESASRPQRPVKSAGPVRASPGHLLTPPTHAEVRETLKTDATRESPMPVKTDFDFVWPQPDAFSEEDMIDRTTPISLTNLRQTVQMPQTSVRPPSSSSRPTAPTPPKSQRPSSSSSRPTAPTPCPSSASSLSSIPSPEHKPPSSQKGSHRPKAPSPYKMERKTLEEEDMFRTETPDYDEEAKKHGWLMEVHGDPLNLKKISRRLPYTVKVDEPETERDPPKIHMENIETFFLNTIPRRPMAFTIDKEWISEMIHSKRMEMQKKHGINYRYKNFSFVY